MRSLASRKAGAKLLSYLLHLSGFFAPNHDLQLPFWLGMRTWGDSSSSGVRSSAEPDDVEEEEPLAKSCGGTAFRESD